MSQLELQLRVDSLRREEREGARVRCVQLGNRLRVLCVSVCDNPSWKCQFPHSLRRAGLEFLVNRLIAMRQHYRALPPFIAIEGPIDDSNTPGDGGMR